MRFVGATLWTDYALGGAPSSSMGEAARQMNDHRFIATGGRGARRFMPEDALERHRASRRFLKHFARARPDDRTVVVTHHAPHPGSVAARYAGDPLNPAFVSDLSDLIATYRPALRVHGHTHSSFDYTVGSTRIVCNPHGYGKENPAFDPALVIDVGEGAAYRPAA